MWIEHLERLSHIVFRGKLEGQLLVCILQTREADEEKQGGGGQSAHCSIIQQ